MENQEAKALNSGNTNKPEFKEWNFKKKNCFFITLNCEIFEGENNEPKYEESSKKIIEKYNNIHKYLTKLKYNYYLAAIEKNKQDFDHIHIFIQFDSPHKLCIEKMEGANIQVMKSSVNCCIKYIKKDGNILNEYGEPNFITGAPSIKDILNTDNPDDILDRVDFRFYSCINKIKGNNNWRQGLFNTKKNIYFINFNQIDNYKKKFKRYYLASLDDKNNYKNLSTNTAIHYSNYILKLLMKINTSHNGYHLADIKNILIFYDDINNYRTFMKEYNNYLIQNKIVECNISKI